MKLKIRDLINPLILNNTSMVGFMGDSEYVDEDGELVMGYWAFNSIDELNGAGRTPFSLDDMIDESELFDVEDMLFFVKNDDGVVCKILFIYRRG